MKLVIAEKPSVGAANAAVMAADEKRNPCDNRRYTSQRFSTH